MPQIKHPVLNPVHGRTGKLQVMSFGHRPKLKLKTAQDVRFLNLLHRYNNAECF
ncbi:hypothetical protein H0R92_13090 [Treponema sp. OMZ 840]